MRSNSIPGFLRTASRNNYVRENSKFRRGSEIRRSGLLQEATLQDQGARVTKE